MVIFVNGAQPPRARHLDALSSLRMEEERRLGKRDVLKRILMRECVRARPRERVHDGLTRV